MLLLLIGAGVGLVIALFGVLAVVMTLNNLFRPGYIPPNVTVQTASEPLKLGGLSIEQAAAQLANLPVQDQIILRDGARAWPVAAADLGVKVDAYATAARAAGKDENLLAKTGKMLNGMQVPLAYTVDVAKTAETLTALSSQIDVAPTAMEAGRKLNVNATVAALPADPAQWLAAGAIDLVMESVEPVRTTYIVEPGEELNIIAKKFNVAVSDIIALNNISNPDFIYPGQKLLIPAAGVWVPNEREAPPAPLSVGKAIAVELTRQRIFAYENGRLVRSALISTGKVGNETVQGDYKIYVKYAVTRMRGPDYDIPDVPWTMYFYKGYGIHGAYWHNTFGRPRSHGCVNLDVDEAKWFFDFAPVGTLVRIIP